MKTRGIGCLLLGCVVALGCSKDGLIDSTGDTGVRELGVEGGEVRGSGVKLTVPEGALSEKVRLEIRKIDTGLPEGFVGTAVELLPEGITFAKPVTVTFTYDPAALEDPASPELLRVATVAGADWEPLNASEIDTSARTVKGALEHFSKWGLIQICGNYRTCAAGKTCVRHRCVSKEVCDNGVDDDKDGLVDCSDADCASSTLCQASCCFDTIGNRCVTACCQNGVCLGNCVCGAGWCSKCAATGAESSCTDGADNDADGFIDCKDPDCAKDPACAVAATEICNNGLDDDADGKTDCADSDCSTDPVACPVCCFDTIANSCVGSCCSNNVCLGNCFCSNAVCSTCGSTTPEVCDNGVDDDKDGLVDCKDSDCASNTKCQNCITTSPTGCCYPTCAAGQTLECLGANICGYPCSCVTKGDAGTPTPTNDGGSVNIGNWYSTCGDPVCRGYTGGSGYPKCTPVQMAGEPCGPVGTKCDPQDSCNALLVCATSDPKQQAGGCPISRAQFKKDIRYLGEAELAQYRDELLGLKLATWRYKGAPERERLGFILDDAPVSKATDGARDQVDLYGYTSLAVAAAQVQAKELEGLKQQVEALQRALEQRCPKAAKR